MIKAPFVINNQDHNNNVGQRLCIIAVIYDFKLALKYEYFNIQGLGHAHVQHVNGYHSMTFFLYMKYSIEINYIQVRDNLSMHLDFFLTSTFISMY